MKYEKDFAIFKGCVSVLTVKTCKVHLLLDCIIDSFIPAQSIGKLRSGGGIRLLLSILIIYEPSRN